MQIKRLLGAFLALVAVLLIAVGSYQLGQHKGIKQGVDTYHNLCYTYGGIVVDETNGTVVACKGLTQLPEKELQNFLDKPPKMV